jgi:hypothetical protein
MKLQPQPAKVLAVLIRRAGEVVARQTQSFRCVLRGGPERIPRKAVTFFEIAE